MERWKVRGRWLDSGGPPLIMGVLNTTPDSFSDGGRYTHLDGAVTRAEGLIAAGADLIDIGGESSRPGAEPVTLQQELDRVIPLVERLRPCVAIPISVDTTKPAVARAAIRAGVDILNDIGGLTDPAMRAEVAASDVGVVLMHMQGTPRTMQVAPRYDDVCAEVIHFLTDQIESTVAAGVDRARIAVDPGIGFGKTIDHNQALLRHLERLRGLGCPILVGTSRKGFLGTLTGKSVADRDPVSVVSALACAVGGASIVRVHDVAATRDAWRIWTYQRGWGTEHEAETPTQTGRETEPR